MKTVWILLLAARRHIRKVSCSRLQNYTTGASLVITMLVNAVRARMRNLVQLVTAGAALHQQFIHIMLSQKWWDASQRDVARYLRKKYKSLLPFVRCWRHLAAANTTELSDNGGRHLTW